MILVNLALSSLWGNLGEAGLKKKGWAAEDSTLSHLRSAKAGPSNGTNPTTRCSPFSLALLSSCYSRF